MGKKMAAPIIIGIIGCFYMIMWICLLFWGQAPLPILLLIGIPMLALLFLLIHVVMERIHEIRSNEEDDLSKY